MKRSLKDAAKKGDKDVCKVLAKEIIRARKACNKIYTSKAHLNSVSLQMKNQLATIRVAGSVSKSTEVMQAMQSLIRIPEIAATMREMSKEMMKAGIIEEMLDETMDSIEDSEDMEDEADEEVDKASDTTKFILESVISIMIKFCINLLDFMGGDSWSVGHSSRSCYGNSWSSRGLHFRRRRTRRG